MMQVLGNPIRRKKLLLWIVLIVTALLIKAISYFPAWVETHYTYSAYPVISRIQRFLLGWLPLSLGDIFYAVLVIAIIRVVAWLIRITRKRQFTPGLLKTITFKIIFVCLIVYVTFYGLWGLNYSRTGIAGQLGLKEDQYTVKDLDTLVNLLHARLNAQAGTLTQAMRDSFKSKKNLFVGAVKGYEKSAKTYPFLQYHVASVKPSLYSYLGNYLGFQGYYNPFSGEAQVNTTIPQSVEPFVTAHEIAHQLGYAKESEANFVGFLAGNRHPSVNFRYSVYFDMYHYGNWELFWADSVKAKSYDSTLHRQVKHDQKIYREFYKKYRNPVEPLITWVYGHFLKANNQPKGRESYNEVVSWLIAYYKKYGKDAI